MDAQASLNHVVEPATNWRYRAHGLTIAANRPLAGAMPAPPDAAPDLRIWLDSPGPAELLEASQVFRCASAFTDDQGQPVLRAWDMAGGDYVRLALSRGIQYIVDRQGERVWVWWPEEPGVESAAMLLLRGFVLGYVLSLRGAITLHASSIAVHGRALALFGDSGAGKSTTAAGLAQAGHPFLTDDIVVVSATEQGFLVNPGFPRVRLWASADRALQAAPQGLSPLMPGWEKGFFDLQPEISFCPRPLPLAAIYWLAERRAGPLQIEPASPAASVAHMLKDRAVPGLADEAMHLREFRAIGHVSSHTPVRRVTIPDDLTQLPAVSRAILADFKCI